MLTFTPSGRTTFALSMPPISSSNLLSCTRCASRDISLWWLTRLKKILQIQIHHPAVTSLQVLFGLGYRRMAAPLCSESVAALVKRRLVHRFEHLPDRLLHHPVNHVRNAQPSLASSRLGYPHAPDVSSSVAPLQQGLGQLRLDLRPVLTHLLDTLPVRTGRPLVGSHSFKRRFQCLDHFFQGRCLCLLVLGLCLSLRARSRRPSVVGPNTFAGSLVGSLVGCFKVQFDLH